jgi:hypothetical protein
MVQVVLPNDADSVRVAQIAALIPLTDIVDDGIRPLLLDLERRDKRVLRLAVTVAVQTELRSQVRIRPVCNRWHLTESCSQGDDCFYDHEPLTPSSKRALELLARSIGELLHTPPPLDLTHVRRPAVSVEQRLRHLRDLLARRYGQRGTWFGLGVDHDLYRPRPVERRRDTVIFYARGFTARRAVPLGEIALQQLHVGDLVDHAAARIGGNSTGRNCPTSFACHRRPVVESKAVSQ